MHYLGFKNPIIFDISDSGLKFAKTKLNFKIHKGNIQQRFPFKQDFFDVAYCFDVLEHLEFPSKVLSEINNVLKPKGILFLAIPNMKPDGVHHKRRWKLKELISDLEKCGFSVVWVDNNVRFNGNYSLKQIFASKTQKEKFKKIISNLGYFFIPKNVWFFLSVQFPDLFSSMQILKVKKN